jgi:hypothetical protein
MPDDRVLQYGSGPETRLTIRSGRLLACSASRSLPGSGTPTTCEARFGTRWLRDVQLLLTRSSTGPAA